MRPQTQHKAPKATIMHTVPHRIRNAKYPEVFGHEPERTYKDKRGVTLYGTDWRQQEAGR